MLKQTHYEKHWCWNLFTAGHCSFFLNIGICVILSPSNLLSHIHNFPWILTYITAVRPVNTNHSLFIISTERYRAITLITKGAWYVPDMTIPQVIQHNSELKRKHLTLSTITVRPVWSYPAQCCYKFCVVTVTEGLILFFIEAACSQISDNKMVPPPGSAGFGVSAGVGSRGQCKLSVCVYAGRLRLCL